VTLARFSIPPLLDRRPTNGGVAFYKDEPFGANSRRSHIRRKAVAGLACVAAMALAAPAAALAGQGHGVSSSHGANAHGNAVSSGATPQPAGN
jgi:hypothetical protein